MSTNEVSLNSIAKGMVNYFEKRSEGSIDLISVVRSLLQQNNIPAQDIAHYYDECEIIKDAADKVPDVQKWCLNRYWMHQLYLLDVSTLSIRFYLSTNGTAEYWLESFTNHVLPFIVKHNLPKKLNLKWE